MEAGSRLGHFTIVGTLGKGGMGEVWRARDGVLGREVALKTLPREFVRDAERLARFEREARLLAAISHPHIGAIYGLEQHADERFLVLELIEGQTLAERLLRGALPVADSLRLALQLAEALEAAHERGVVHRDLKPANIKITPDRKLKVLDFGLAKALARESDSAQVATMDRDATEHGAILGTAAYMAPEQARGEPAGVRADVWAFGCVLYEMLTGRRAFDGETVSDMLANVLRGEPDWLRLPTGVHPRIRYVLERCLEKESRNRYVGISDARVEIEKALADPAGALAAAGTRTPRPATARWAAATIAAAVVAALAGGASILSMDRSTRVPVVRFDDPLRSEPNTVARQVLQLPLIDISRDGTRVAYATGQEIFIRDLDEPEPRVLRGVTGIPTTPRFSPDGQWLAYTEGPPPWSVKTLPVTGGTPQTVARDLESPTLGLDWRESGALVFVQPEGIVQVPIEGGPQEVIVPATGDEAFSGVHLLPGDDDLLFTVTTATGATRWDEGQVVMQSLRTGERRVVWRGGSDARYAGSGHLVYAQGTSLWAVPFDLSTGEVTGSNVTVVAGVTRATGDDPWSDTAQYAVSDGGTLAYLDLPSVSAPAPRRELAWVKRDGTLEPIPVAPGDFTYARVSPDGAHVALVVGQIGEGRGSDLWILDVRTQRLRRLTFDLEVDAPVWSQDSSRIYFRRVPVRARTSIYSVATEGGTHDLIAEGSADFTFLFPSDLSLDGETMLLLDATKPGDLGLATLTVRDGKFDKLLDDRGSQTLPVFAPNGSWIAYVEDGGLNIRPFPDVQRGSTPVGEGTHPVFSRDGAELFSFDGGGLSVATVEYDGPSLRVGPARTLFRGTYWYGGAGPSGADRRAWDPHPDGDRFFMILDAQQVRGGGPTACDHGLGRGAPAARARALRPFELDAAR